LVIDLAKSSRVAPAISPARREAFEILLRVEAGAYASVLLATREQELIPLDRALCHELVMGVLRWQLWLDKLIEYYANRKVSELDLGVRLILRLGLYQLRFLSRVPASAAVNESVKLVNLARLRSAGGLVNAVLRRATREPRVDPAETINDLTERIAVATSHPAWLIERWIKTLGSDDAEAFARSNNEAAPVAFRVIGNRAKCSEVSSQIIEQLQQSGAELIPSMVAEGAWRISGAGSLLSELVAEGRVYIQDEASQLVAAELQAQPAHRVLDLCAAPGGKTTQIADIMCNSGIIVASDLHEHRLRAVIQTARTHQLSNIHCVTLDGLQPLPLAQNAFDRVLVDAPCSGTGTLRRNPEIRWRITPDDIQDLSQRQERLLSNVAATLKPGGRLVYSTCSVEIDENEGVRQAFLENNKDFRPAELSLEPALKTSKCTARTWPHRDGTDGFFIVAFERKSE
jgi:16S rRNA (cytosine967-C5)-methyltransferase